MRLDAKQAGAFWMLAASLVLAGMAATIKLASEYGVPLVQVLFFRGFVSLLVVWLWMRIAGIGFRTPHWKIHLRRAIAGTLSMVGFFAGISMLPLPTAVTLSYTSTLWLAGMLLMVHRERPTPPLILAMFAAFAGIVLLVRPSFERSQWLGVVLTLGSAIGSAVAALNIRSLGVLAEPVPRTVAYFSLVVTLMAVPGFLLSSPARIDGHGLLLLVSLGLLATAGQAFLTLAYQRGQTLLASLFGYSQIIFATLLAILLWDSHPSAADWLAMALIIASGAAATVFARSAARTATPATTPVARSRS